VIGEGVDACCPRCTEEAREQDIPEAAELSVKTTARVPPAWDALSLEKPLSAWKEKSAGREVYLCEHVKRMQEMGTEAYQGVVSGDGHQHINQKSVWCEGG
jgi:hypothetical protein